MNAFISYLDHGIWWSRVVHNRVWITLKLKIGCKYTLYDNICTILGMFFALFALIIDIAWMNSRISDDIQIPWKSKIQTRGKETRYKYFPPKWYNFIGYSECDCSWLSYTLLFLVVLHIVYIMPDTPKKSSFHLIHISNHLVNSRPSLKLYGS